jgi:secondary thiamine-phosphate synthase enzyme
MNHHFYVPVNGQGLYEITSKVQAQVEKAAIAEGLATIFIQHTSASLLIQENADPAVQDDLANWLNRLVVENDPLYTHTQEGPDDMPAHIKGALTAVNLSVPIVEAQLALGTWQGIYLWEHRHHVKERKLILNIMD